MSEEFIPSLQTLLGSYAALDYAQIFYDLSEDLNTRQKFQGAIPLATISMEESLKGTELAIKFRKNQSLTKDEWEKLKNHKYKLTHVKNFAIDIMEKATKEEEEKTKEELRKEGMEIPAVSGKQMAGIMKKLNYLHSHFKMLREICFYSDWNENEKSWNFFSELSKDKQEALAFFVLEESKLALEFLKFSIEKIVNTMRKDGKLKDMVLPYPSYKEFRTIDKYESRVYWEKNPSKLERVLHNKGAQVLQKIISIKLLQSIDYGIFSDTMGEYLNQIGNQKDDGRYLHPLTKGILMALHQVKDKENGRYGAVATDSESEDGKVAIGFFVGVEVKDGKYTISEIHNLNKKEYKYPMEIIEKILRTEIIIERHEGASIPIPTYIEALSVVGIKAKMTKRSDLEEAIKLAKQSIDDKKFRNTPKEWIEEIKLMNGIEDWDKINTFSRMTINSNYGMQKYPGYDIYITPSPAIEKWKARVSIMHAVHENFLKTV